jgi:hypothetical protein
LSSRVERAFEMAERFVRAVERIADALEHDSGERSIDAADPEAPREVLDVKPPPVRPQLTEKGANDVEALLRRRGIG